MDIFDDIFENKIMQSNTILGITTGTVKEIYDNKFPGMIKVEFFMTDGTINVSDWIRVVVPYGGKNKGMYFLPDIGDEVVIAFEHGNIEKPYVLGCLWNNKDTIPDDTVKEDNTIKKLRTRGGHEVIFDDTENKSKIKISTPKKSEILIDDENSAITITSKGDKGEDVINLDSKNGVINIKAQKKIKLDTGSSTIDIDGSGKKIEIKSDTISLDGKTIKIKGQSVNIQGNQTEIKASASLNVKCDGVTTIKGGMVKIN